jgi:hypothetical protein
MISKFNLITVLIVLFLQSYLLFAQKDSDTINSDEDSIVYVYEAPLIIKKNITHKEEVYNSWFLDFFASSFSHSNVHRLCAACSDYKKEIGKSVNPVLDYGMGATITYLPEKRKILFATGLNYSSFHENFKHQKDSTGIITSKNKYNYLDLNIGMGYWFLRKKKISFIVNGKIIISKLLLSQGNTLDYSDFSNVLSNAEAKRDANWLLSGKLGLKMIFFNDKRMKIFVEPFTRTNFTSVLSYKKNYYLMRWAKGLEFGLMYVL